LLSNLARRSEFIDDILKANDDAIEKRKLDNFFTQIKTTLLIILGAGGLNKNCFL
jgi:hypothetical protein